MSPAPDPTRKQLDIRKYPNRRYYDATHSRHLTLEEIRSLVRDGYDVTVTDSKTGADITAQVLTQIILELETPKLDTFPVPLLLRLIRANDELVKDFVERYFNQALKSWLDYQKQFEEQLRQFPGMPGIYSPFAAWTQAMATPFRAGPESGQNETKDKPPTASPSPETAEMRDTVKDLQRQLDALQQSLKTKKVRRSKR